MQKLLIIGGNPKGHQKAFSPKTRSGRILHGLLTRHQILADVMDLWKDAEQERIGDIRPRIIQEIEEKCIQGYRVIVVGRYMHRQLTRQLRRPIAVHYLPHPASRTRRDRLRLENGLVGFARNQTLVTKAGFTQVL